jgi:hypothetical protein
MQQSLGEIDPMMWLQRAYLRTLATRTHHEVLVDEKQIDPTRVRHALAVLPKPVASGQDGRKLVIGPFRAPAAG